jgi:glycosyltransferase involved in cell wall biosynthesis
MSRDKPRVSIGLPVFNGENHIEQALESILAQTYSDLELIICDNASTDRTQEICQAYAAKDRRIRYHRNETNLGGVRNYNRTFELSSGRYFKWAAHDDALAPDFLRRCVQVLIEYPEVVLCHPKAKIIDEQGRVIEDYDVQLRTDSPQPHVRFHDLIWVRHWCVEIYGLIRRNALEMTPLHGEYASSDRVLLVQLALLGRFHEIGEYLFFSRRHGQQGSRLVHDLHAYSAWFNPTEKGQFQAPASKLVLQHFRAVRDAPLSPSQRARCYLSGLFRLGKYLTILSRDVTVPVRLMLRRPKRPAGTRGSSS